MLLLLIVVVVLAWWTGLLTTMAHTRQIRHVSQIKMKFISDASARFEESIPVSASTEGYVHAIKLSTCRTRTRSIAS